MTTGQRLKSAMDSKSVTMYRLAKELGIHQTTVKNWLDGKGEPRISEVRAIATALGVSVLDLLGANTPEARQLMERDAQREERSLAEIEGEAVEQLKDVTLDRDILDMLMLNDSPMDTHKAVIQSMQFLMDGIELDLDEDSNGMIIAEAIIRKNRWKK